MAKLKTVQIDGVDFDINVSDEGEFYAMVDSDGTGRERMIKAGNLKTLEQKLRGITRQKLANLAIPVTVQVYTWNDRPLKLRHANLTGIHATHDRPLVIWDDGGQRAELDSNDEVLRRLTNDEVAALNTRHDKIRRDSEKLTSDLRALRVSGHKLVQDAMADQVKSGTE